MFLEEKEKVNESKGKNSSIFELIIITLLLHKKSSSFLNVYIFKTKKKTTWRKSQASII